jgi:hypothetical protein
MSKVFVLDTNFIPLNPIHSAQARQLQVVKSVTPKREGKTSNIFSKKTLQRPHSFPPITKLSTVLVGVSWRFR